MAGKKITLSPAVMVKIVTNINNRLFYTKISLSPCTFCRESLKHTQNFACVPYTLTCCREQSTSVHALALAALDVF